MRFSVALYITRLETRSLDASKERVFKVILACKQALEYNRRKRSFKSPVLFVLDKEIGEIFKACEEQGYVLMVTADHGNAEQMFGVNGGPHTAHTTNRGE